MSGILDKAKGMADNKLNQESQPGDGVERSADSGVNNGISPSLFPLSFPRVQDICGKGGMLMKKCCSCEPSSR